MFLFSLFCRWRREKEPRLQYLLKAFETLDEKASAFPEGVEYPRPVNNARTQKGYLLYEPKLEMSPVPYEPALQHNQPPLPNQDYSSSPRFARASHPEF